MQLLIGPVPFRLCLVFLTHTQWMVILHPAQGLGYKPGTDHVLLRIQALGLDTFSLSP